MQTPNVDYRVSDKEIKMEKERREYLVELISKTWSAEFSGQIKNVLEDKLLLLCVLTEEDKVWLKELRNEALKRENEKEDPWPWNESGY
jgi:hypothetical protein